MKLFVCNIAFEATDEDVRNLFSEIGPLKACRLVKTDGKSRGFGFVEFADALDASRAVDDLNAQTFMGRKLVVQEARKD
jgi:RNA recognition motif-containing protein